MKLTSIILAGVGGQGIIRASDILAYSAFLEGYDVKKSEIRGMSQRGGSVRSDVRFGERVLSPTIPLHTADFLLALTSEEIEPNRRYLARDCVIITPEKIEELPHPATLNTALLGVLSISLEISEEHWLEAIRAHFTPRVLDMNLDAFHLGRQAGKKTTTRPSDPP